MSEHSLFSASASSRWLACPGSVALSAGLPNRSSPHAREGTAAHRVLSLAFGDGPDIGSMAGQIMDVDGHDVVVDEDMILNAEKVFFWASTRAIQLGGTVEVDSRVYYAHELGAATDDAFGTLDLAIVSAKTLVICDYKYGRGVAVSASEPDPDRDDGVLLPNTQLALYALGKLRDEPMIEFESVELVIWQPRVSDEPSVFVMHPDMLLAWAAQHAQPKAGSVLNALETVDSYSTGIVAPSTWETAFLNVGEKQCRFCPAKQANVCPAIRNETALVVFDHAPATPAEFEAAAVPGKDVIAAVDDAWLDAVFPKLDLIDGWLAAVRGEIERRLLAGTVLRSAKLVQGRQGNRAWADPVAAEAALKAMRLRVEDMYDLKLISPTTAEKLAGAKTIGPRQWKALQAGITRAPGVIHVAPISDKRPAVSQAATALEFEPVAPADDDML